MDGDWRLRVPRRCILSFPLPVRPKAEHLWAMYVVHCWLSHQLPPRLNARRECRSTQDQSQVLHFGGIWALLGWWHGIGWLSASSSRHWWHCIHSSHPLQSRANPILRNQKLATIHHIASTNSQAGRRRGPRRSSVQIPASVQLEWFDVAP